MLISEAAKRLLEDYDAGRPGSIFEEVELTLSIEQAYDLQFEVAALREARGEQVAGYKIGCISDIMQKQLGIDHPVFGHIWDTELYPSGVQLRAEKFDGLAIEGELAVRILDDVQSPESLKQNPSVIGEFHAVIELHNYVFRGPESIRAAELIANNAIHAGVVIRDLYSNASNVSPHSKLQVHRNGENIGAAVTAHIQHGAFDVVESVVKHLSRRGCSLKRNQLILTGSPLPLWKVERGDAIEVTSKGTLGVSCTVVP